MWEARYLTQLSTNGSTHINNRSSVKIPHGLLSKDFPIICMRPKHQQSINLQHKLNMRPCRTALKESGMASNIPWFL